MVGSRILATGAVIYGAASPEIHQDIVDEEEAYSALLRMRVEGGIGSISYKNYNLPIRSVGFRFGREAFSEAECTQRISAEALEGCQEHHDALCTRGRYEL